MAEIKYFVAEAYRYADSKNWEYSIKGIYDTISEAKQQFHSRLGAISKSSNDHVMAIIYDSLGNIVMSDFDDTATEETPEA